MKDNEYQIHFCCEWPEVIILESEKDKSLRKEDENKQT
jgi:hypothetical protein